MHRMRARWAVAFLAASLAVVTLVSCATTSGGAFSAVVAAESRSETPPPPPPPPPPTEGLQIITIPDHVEVYVDNVFVGVTPLVIVELSTGSHIIRLYKPGYYDLDAWLAYAGAPMVYQVTLTPIVGFVQLQAAPPDAHITIGGQSVSPGLIQLPVGSYDVLGRAFGYQDYHGRVNVIGPSVIPLDIQLQPAPFGITGFSLVQRVVNPDNPGLLGSLEAGFVVSGPGDGSLAVIDPSGTEVRRDQLPPFSTWNQRWTWRPSSSLPDGEYRLVLSGRGASDGAEVTREEIFRIDHTVAIAPRSSWSGSAGLLFAPAVETLPYGSWQISLLLAAAFDQVNYRTPAELALRIGLAPGAELDLMGGLVFASYGVPLTGSAALRWEMLRPTRPLGVGVGLDAKLALQGEPPLGFLTTDTFANFSGASFGVPVQIALGPVSLLTEVAIIASPWRVDYSASGPVTATNPGAWLYYRAGVLIDAGPLVAGLSASLRSAALPAGIASIDIPVEIGAEAHYLVPGTHLLVSAIAAGELFSPTSWYFYGGGGLGLIY